MIRQAVLAAVLAAAGAAAAADWTVAQLFEALRQQDPGRATFQEKKYLALLDKPVESSGELLFTRPARLEKRTLAPHPESVIVDGDVAVIERNQRKRTFALRDQPAVAALIDSIRGTLAGDFSSLARTYSVALEGPREHWRMVLRPLDAAVAPLVDRIEISGAGAEVQTVEIFQADGDRSVMTITPVR